jgi:hypothetical protein
MNEFKTYGMNGFSALDRGYGMNGFKTRDTGSAMNDFNVGTQRME